MSTYIYYTQHQPFPLFFEDVLKNIPTKTTTTPNFVYRYDLTVSLSLCTSFPFLPSLACLLGHYHHYVMVSFEMKKRVTFATNALLYENISIHTLNKILLKHSKVLFLQPHKHFDNSEKYLTSLLTVIKIFFN